MKKLFKILVVLTAMIAVGLLSASCKKEEEEYFEPETEPPIIEPVLPDNEAEVRNSAAALFTAIAKNPQGYIMSKKSAKKNFSINNLSISGDNLIGVEGLRIDTIDFTDHIVRIKYADPGVYDENFVPIDEYVMSGDYGSYSVLYDGFSYQYEFDPYSPIMTMDSNIVFPAIFPDSMWYNTTEECYRIDSDAIKNILLFYMNEKYTKINDSRFDIATDELRNLISNSYITCKYRLNSNMTDIEYFSLLISTHSVHEGSEFTVRHDILTLEYSLQGRDMSLRINYDHDMKVLITAKVTTVDSLQSNVNASIIVTDPSNPDKDVTMHVSGRIAFNTAPYVEPTGFLKEKIELGENLTKNAYKIQNTHAAKFTIKNQVKCNTVYVYDDKIQAYVLFKPGYKDFYYYAGFTPVYDKQSGCIGEIDLEHSVITVISHNYSEETNILLANKYSGDFIASTPCETLAIYDSEYKVYVYFCKKQGYKEYAYAGFHKTMLSNWCSATIDSDERTITPKDHCGLEDTIRKVKDIEYAIKNYEALQCKQILVYDSSSGYYLIFNINGTSAKYVGYSDIAYSYACVGKFNSYTIEVTQHSH